MIRCYLRKRIQVSYCQWQYLCVFRAFKKIPLRKLIFFKWRKRCNMKDRMRTS